MVIIFGTSSIVVGTLAPHSKRFPFGVGGVTRRTGLRYKAGSSSREDTSASNNLGSNTSPDTLNYSHNGS